ncbi:MAG: hypothetical protein WAW13_03060, partial [Minisyncoccia bacterium]
TPSVGYEVATLMVDGTTTVASTTYTFGNVQADHTIDVTFSALHSIVVTGGANGTTSSLGTSTVSDGSNFTVTFTPNAGYDVASIIVDGTTTATSTSYTFTNVTSDHTLSVSFIALHDIVAIAGIGGTVTPTGTTTVTDGNNLTYAITPNAGYVIGSIVVDGTSTATSTSYTFTNITAPHTISATFLALYDVVSSSGANGTVSPLGTTTVLQGDTLSFSITPATGYVVATLVIDGVSIPVSTTYTFVNIQSGHTVSATFAPIATHTIFAAAGANGNISPTGTTTVTEGANQTFIITPAFGYNVASLTIDGTTTSAALSHTFVNVVGDHTISATFSSLPTYNIIASAGANGTINPTGSTTVVEGYNQTFTISPATGFGIATLSIDGVTTTPAATYTFVNVLADHTINATFSALPTHVITASAGTSGTISPLGPTSVFEGYNQTFTITPLTGFAISTLLIDGSGVPTTTTYTFTNVQAAHTIAATFVALPTYSIVASAGANGSISPTGTTSVFEGYNQTFTITPDVGFGVATLTIDSVSTTTGATYTFMSVTAPHTIDVTFSALPTHDLVSSAGANGTISPLGTTTVFEGSNQTYVITPSVGYAVATLVIDSVSVATTTTSYTFTNVTGGHTISATFSALPTHSIVAEPTTNGAISPLGTTTVFEGSNQTYAITPAVGYTVATLVIDGVSVATTTTSYTFVNVAASHTISATFTTLPTYDLVSSAGANGTISPLGTTTVFEGSNQTYAITPSVGFTIGALTIDGISTTTTATYTFNNVMATHTIDATFVALPTFDLVSTAGVNGSISPLGTTTVFLGGTQTYTITPSAGFAVATLAIDGVSTAVATTYTFTNVTATHTIDATFSPIPSSGGGGGGGSKKKAALQEQALIDSLMQTLSELKLKVAVLIAKRDAEKLATQVAIEKQKEIARKNAAVTKKKSDKAEKDMKSLESTKINKEMETLVSPVLKESFTPGAPGKKRNVQGTTSETESTHTSSTGEVIFYEVKSFFSIFIVGVISTIVGFFSAF